MLLYAIFKFKIKKFKVKTKKDALGNLTIN